MKAFGPFRLDPENQCLWRDQERIILTPKVFSVLRYLVEHPARLVTQDELLEAIWPETYVQPEVLRTYIQELRKILGDRPKDPLYIETLPKRGYQFIAAVTSQGAPQLVAEETAQVGRERELAELDSYLQRALKGQRQIVFVTGEAGIGKSTLIDAFEQRLSGQADRRAIRGQCVEGFGGKEAYYPVLDAFSQLVRGAASEHVVQTLASQAPTWLMQFPSLLKPEQREALQREILGATRERMVREICQALEALTVETPLVLILEDLHWGDPSTLDLISALARHRTPAKLMLVGTYRPVEVILLQSPLKTLKQDLVLHKLCAEIPLERLAEDQVAEYLSAEFPSALLPYGLAALIHRHSEGNPLFMASIVADLVKSGQLTNAGGCWELAVPLEQIEPGVPETLQQMLEIQVERLGETEQGVLKSASVSGRRFSAWAVAGMLGMGIGEAEEVCERFARRQQFLRRGRGPGAVGSEYSAHYEFRHALYLKVLYRQIPLAQRAQWHRALAEKIETLLAPARAETRLELASEIALHFENGRQFERAVRYLILSAENAARRYAHRDAIAILEHARGLLAGLPVDVASALEIEILEHISDAHYAVGSMEASAEADGAALALAEQGEMKAAQVSALTRLARVMAFSDPDGCVAVCERAARVCSAYDDPLLQARTHMLAATWRIINNGWSQEDADRCAEARCRIKQLLGPEKPAYYEVLYAHVQALRGEYRDAYEIARSGLERAVETHSLVVYLSSLSSLALALMHLGWWGELRGTVESGIELAEKNGNEPWRNLFQAMLGWLHLQAFDLDGAGAIAGELLKTQTEEPACQVRTMAMLTVGYAELAAGNAEQALQYFVKVRDRVPTPKFFLQWYWRMNSASGLVGAYLELGELDQASASADLFLSDALKTADPALRAQAWDAVARVAARKGDTRRALECVEEALAAVQDHDLPSVSWRLHATAARISLQKRDFENTEQHCLRASSSLRRAAASFGQDDPLRRSLLSAVEKLEVNFHRELDNARIAGANN